jgi:hypothetical protein
MRPESLEVQLAAAEVSLLQSAVVNQALAVLTIGKGINRRQLMVQLHPTTGRDADSEFAARIVDGDQNLIQQFLTATEPVSVWFQDGSSLLIFETTLLKKRRAGISGIDLLMRWPPHIAVLEERLHARYWVQADFALTGTLEVLNPSRQVISRTPVRFWDVGNEGASVICPSQPKAIAITIDDWLNLQFRPPKQDPFTLPAICRHLSVIAGGGVRVGVQFMPSGDPAAAAAQKALAVLVAQLRQLCTGVAEPTTAGATRRG